MNDRADTVFLSPSQQALTTFPLLPRARASSHPPSQTLSPKSFRPLPRAPRTSLFSSSSLPTSHRPRSTTLVSPVTTRQLIKSSGRATQTCLPSTQTIPCLRHRTLRAPDRLQTRVDAHHTASNRGSNRRRQRRRCGLDEYMSLQLADVVLTRAGLTNSTPQSARTFGSASSASTKPFTVHHLPP